MRNHVWNRLVALETRDVVSAWHKQITGRELSARRAMEITSSAKQAREFFRNAQEAEKSVKSLLSFYGVSSLSRATLLLLKRGSGEESLTASHGLETVDWSTTLAGEVAAGLARLESLSIRTSRGTFTDLLRETENLMCLHVHSSAVDWSVPYGVPETGQSFTLGDLLSRLPDLTDEHHQVDKKYVHVSSMTFTQEAGFFAQLPADGQSGVRNAYAALGYAATDVANGFELRATTELFESQPPQFMHSYVRKMFGTIPSLHLVQPFAPATRYSQIALTYALAYYLGMLTRYFPTHWVSLFSAHKGDRLWPAINAMQQYVDAAFPELVLELINYVVGQRVNDRDA